MNSRVHPKSKIRKRCFQVYRVSNWAEYDRTLVQRGDITLWFSPDATDTWTPGPSGKRGGQRKFSDQAIEMALVLRLVFNLPLRQAEGFLRSVLSLMALDLVAPDHTTVFRRSQQVDVGLRLAATRAAFISSSTAPGYPSSAKVSGPLSSMVVAASAPGRSFISVSIDQA